MSIVQNYFLKNMMFFLVLLSLLFGFSLGKRVIRVAGDDKVYVSQALEMAQSGHWFFQTTQKKADYQKGPLHLILLRIGHVLFDRSMWATTYMNFGFLLMALFFLFRLKDENGIKAENKEIALLFLSLLAVFLFTYASQMECALACIYASSLFFIYQSVHRKKKYDEYILWFLVGIAGWLKSPLHSVLLGVSISLFWIFTGVFIQKLKSLNSWLAWIFGILVCVSLYAPILIYDYWPFWHSYIGRETLWKAWNGSSWYEPILPLFTYFIFPWTLLFFGALIDLFLRLWFLRDGKIFKSNYYRNLFYIGICIILPSLLFFSYFQYRVSTYLIPVVSGVVLVLYSLLKTSKRPLLFSFPLFLTGTILMFFGFIYLVLIFYLKPLPHWISLWGITVFGVGLFYISFVFLRVGYLRAPIFSLRVISAVFIFYFGLSQIMVTLGEREMIDIKEALKKHSHSLNGKSFSFLNMNQGIWSDWGYLNFWINYPVNAIYEWSEVKESIENKNPLIIVNKKELDEFKNLALKLQKLENKDYNILPWTRWQTHGKTVDGEKRWVQALKTKDFSWVEKNYWLVFFQ